MPILRPAPSPGSVCSRVVLLASCGCRKCIFALLGAQTSIQPATQMACMTLPEDETTFHQELQCTQGSAMSCNQPGAHAECLPHCPIFHGRARGCSDPSAPVLFQPASATSACLVAQAVQSQCHMPYRDKYRIGQEIISCDICAIALPTQGRNSAVLCIECLFVYCRGAARGLTLSRFPEPDSART